MKLKEIIEEKKEWRAHVARVNALPNDFQIVYKEIQKYLFKVAPTDHQESMNFLVGIVDLFEEGIQHGKEVLEITGEDVASFCDELFKDVKTYTEINQNEVEKKVNASMKKYTGKLK